MKYFKAECNDYTICNITATGSLTEFESPYSFTLISTYQGSDYVWNIIVKPVTTSIKAQKKMHSIYEELGITKQTEPQYAAFLIAKWICDNCEWSEEDYKNKYNDSIYGMLLEGNGICSNYAALYRDLLNQLEIPCVDIVSSRFNHEWNQVKIDGNWYNVDITWMDEEMTIGNYNGSGKEKTFTLYNLRYFLVSDDFDDSDNSDRPVKFTWSDRYDKSSQFDKVLEEGAYSEDYHPATSHRFEKNTDEYVKIQKTLSDVIKQDMFADIGYDWAY